MDLVNAPVADEEERLLTLRRSAISIARGSRAIDIARATLGVGLFPSSFRDCGTFRGQEQR